VNIKPHWCVVNPQGEIVGLSVNDRSGAWADAERASDESQAELVDHGCVCVLCQIGEAERANNAAGRAGGLNCESKKGESAGAITRFQIVLTQRRTPACTATTAPNARATSERKVMSTTAKELIEIARRADDGLSYEEQGILGQHILSTVRLDNDEPVTRERLEADGWFWDADRQCWLAIHLPHAFQVQQMNLDWVLWHPYKVLKSMGHLRRLVAALGE